MKKQNPYRASTVILDFAPLLERLRAEFAKHNPPKTHLFA